MIKSIQTKFSIKQVIVSPIVLVIIVCFLCSIITFASIETTKDGTPLYKTPIWTIIPFILMLIWTVRYYLKTFKRYIFLDRGFEIKTIFGKEFYPWKTVKQISIIENNYQKILWQYIEEDSLSIYLKNGKSIELYSMYYKNMPEIRRYFNSKDGLSVINSYTKDVNRISKPFIKSNYKGSFIFSFNGIISIFLISLSGLMLLNQWPSIKPIGFIFLIGLPLLIVSVFGFQSYYFKLNQKYLVVKNHIFLHVNHKIDLEKVKVIYFEQKFKKEPSIRIITDDYSIVSFQGATLKNKQWKSLILNLKEQDISIVDELFYEFNE